MLRRKPSGDEVALAASILKRFPVGSRYFLFSCIDSIHSGEQKHLRTHGGSQMWSDPMKSHLFRCGYSLIETSDKRSCELWSNGVEAVTLVIDEKNIAQYAVLEGRSMEEVNLQELQMAISEPLSQIA